MSPLLPILSLLLVAFSFPPPTTSANGIAAVADAVIAETESSAAVNRLVAVTQQLVTPIFTPNQLTTAINAMADDIVASRPFSLIVKDIGKTVTPTLDNGQITLLNGAFSSLTRQLGSSLEAWGVLRQQSALLAYSNAPLLGQLTRLGSSGNRTAVLRAMADVLSLQYVQTQLDWLHVNNEPPIWRALLVAFAPIANLQLYQVWTNQNNS